MRRHFIILSLVALGFGETFSASPVDSLSSPGLDQAMIQAEYVNGEFEKVQLEIARFQSRNSSYSRSDSLCIARHLAVIHSANPITVEVGKHWMHELFKLDTAATLDDMYVSEEIERLFAKVRAEFMERRKPLVEPAVQLIASPAAAAPAASPRPSAAPPRSEAPANSAWKKPVYWILGGAVVAAAATTTIVLMSPDEKAPAEPKEIFVPKGGSGP